MWTAVSNQKKAKYFPPSFPTPQIYFHRQNFDPPSESCCFITRSSSSLFLITGFLFSVGMMEKRQCDATSVLVWIAVRLSFYIQDFPLISFEFSCLPSTVSLVSAFIAVISLIVAARIKLGPLVFKCVPVPNPSKSPAPPSQPPAAEMNHLVLLLDLFPTSMTATKHK